MREWKEDGRQTIQWVSKGFVSVERNCTWGLSAAPLLSQSQQHFTDHGHFRSSRLTITARVCACVTTESIDAVAATTSFATRGVVVAPGLSCRLQTRRLPSFLVLYFLIAQFRRTKEFLVTR